MRGKCTNVTVVENVRQLNGVSGGSGNVELRGRESLLHT
jgi:hypothetical protein